MNKSKLATSDVCQKCGICCKSFSEIIDDITLIGRFQLLKTDKIKVKTFHKDGKIMARVTYDFPCKMLKYHNGIYSCMMYKGKRPSMCDEYPDNLLEFKEIEKEFCKLLTT